MRVFFISGGEVQLWCNTHPDDFRCKKGWIKDEPIRLR